MMVLRIVAVRRVPPKRDALVRARRERGLQALTVGHLSGITRV